MLISRFLTTSRRRYVLPVVTPGPRSGSSAGPSRLAGGRLLELVAWGPWILSVGKSCFYFSFCFLSYSRVTVGAVPCPPGAEESQRNYLVLGSNFMLKLNHTFNFATIPTFALTLFSCIFKMFFLTPAVAGSSAMDSVSRPRPSVRRPRLPKLELNCRQLLRINFTFYNLCFILRSSLSCFRPHGHQRARPGWRGWSPVAQKTVLQTKGAQQSNCRSLFRLSSASWRG